MSDERLDAPDSALDLKQLAHDEKLLTALASGSQPATPDAAFTDLLAGWRDELDDAAAALPPVDVAALLAEGSPRRTPLRGRRAVAAAAAGVVTVLGMTGTAAAISGPHGPLAPLHRVIFGAQHSVSDSTAIQVRALLEKARASIATAVSAGSISDGRRAEIASVLDNAVQLLQRDQHAPKALTQQADSLRASLARIPGQPEVSPSPAPQATPSTADADRGQREPDKGKVSTPPASEEPAGPPSPAESPAPEDGGQPATSTDSRNQDEGHPQPSSAPSSSSTSDGSGGSGRHGGPDGSGGGGSGSGGSGS